MDPHVRNGKVNSRFTGKQLQTNPPKNTSGNVGHFEKFVYAPDSYKDKTTYLKVQPVDRRKLGFGTHDAARRDEFTTTIRTEQYREQLRCETNKTNKTGNTPSSGRDEAQDFKKKEFPRGLRETKHLYDIGRSQETAFDPKSSRDTFYNALMCKSRNRPPRRTGGAYISSMDCGAGVQGLDHGACKPTHGHQRATKTFFDRSHLGESPLS